MRRKNSKPLWHIQYWPSWVLVFFIQLLVLLPSGIVRKVSNGLALLLHTLAGRRRRIADTNIRLCFPEMSEKDRKALVVEIFKENTYGLFEAFMSWLKPWLKPNIRLHNEDILLNAMAQERGVLVLSGHYTHVDMCGRQFSFHHPLNALYRPQNNAVVNHIMEKGREAFLQAAAINQHDLRGMVSCLKQGRILWFPYDQDHGPKSSVFAPFFGISAATLTIPSRLKKLSGCEVLFCYQYRDESGQYHIGFESLPSFTGTDFEADATLLNQHLMVKLRERPTQYMWVHRRFKTRPDGAPSVY